MNLNELRALQVNVSNKLDDVCQSPMPRSAQEVESWQDDYALHVQAKINGVKALPQELKKDVQTLRGESQNVYDIYLDHWFATGMLSLARYRYRKKKLSGLLSDEELKKEREAIYDLRDSKVDINEKRSAFIAAFEDLLEAIQMKDRWFDLYEATNIQVVAGDALVWNSGLLDMYVWQLPTSDPSEKKSYLQIGRIMTIFFFIEWLYKNEDSLDNDKDPFEKIFGLDKILVLYNMTKNV